MTKPHKHAEVIKAWADGAQIQYRFSPNHPWEDIDDPIWIPDDEYRVKPANVVRYLSVMQMPAKSVAVGWGVASKDCAGNQTNAALELKRVLRIELNPDTLELVSATMEKP